MVIGRHAVFEGQNGDSNMVSTVLGSAGLLFTEQSTQDGSASVGKMNPRCSSNLV